MTTLLTLAGVDIVALVAREGKPVSRTRFGSPCRFVRTIDIVVHVIVPEIIAERAPVWACYLRSTSPRWGRAWRGGWS
jgi:hypothetical protein